MALFQVIKYNGAPNTLAWKYPSEEITTLSQLIVNQSQEAILCKGGQVCDFFEAGRYTLSTQNIPILNSLVKLPFGGKAPFTAEVWFVNKLACLDVPWGTTSPIQLEDPKYHIMLPIRSFGQFGIQIVDSRLFLQKLVGTLRSFDTENLINHFRGLYLTKVKNIISNYIIKQEITLLSINAYIDELSNEIKVAMIPTFAEYGIKISSFYVTDISASEKDPSVIKLRESLSKRADMNIVGYSYQQERSFDTLETAASNADVSGLMGAGIGLGMGLGVAPAMGNQMSGIASNIATTEATKPTKPCSSCNHNVDDGLKFCPNCGNSTTESKPNTINCSSCNTELLADTKFCHGCGKKNITNCPSCNQSLLPNAKFCAGCGEKIGE